MGEYKIVFVKVIEVALYILLYKKSDWLNISVLTVTFSSNHCCAQVQFFLFN